jgi:hypothetical protein
VGQTETRSSVCSEVCGSSPLSFDFGPPSAEFRKPWQESELLKASPIMLFDLKSGRILRMSI